MVLRSMSCHGVKGDGYIAMPGLEGSFVTDLGH